jgi:hypothetical protein
MKGDGDGFGFNRISKIGAVDPAFHFTAAPTSVSAAVQNA